MILYKDFETIYGDIEIFEKFQAVGILWANRRNSVADKMAYDRGKRELKLMIEGAK